MYLGFVKLVDSITLVLLIFILELTDYLIKQYYMIYYLCLKFLRLAF